MLVREQGGLVEVTRRLTVGCEFVHESDIDIPAVFQVEPLSDQKVDVIDERWSLEPDGPTRTYTDLYGNPCRRLIIRCRAFGDQLSGDVSWCLTRWRMSMRKPPS